MPERQRRIPNEKGCVSCGKQKKTRTRTRDGNKVCFQTLIFESNRKNLSVLRCLRFRCITHTLAFVRSFAFIRFRTCTETTAVKKTLSNVLVSTRTSSCLTRKLSRPTSCSMGQMTKPRPGWARRLNLPQLSMTPTSAVLMVKQQGTHMVLLIRC